MQITFITGNLKKVHAAREALRGLGVDLVQEALETPEIQDADVANVAASSARYAADLLQKDVVKVDVGLRIEALRGFPGPFIKYVDAWLKPEQILTLMAGVKNREATFVGVIAHCKPGETPTCFRADTSGTIGLTVEGENGWGFDRIFIPKGYSAPLATLSDDERARVWNGEHWIALARHLTNSARDDG